MYSYIQTHVVRVWIKLTRIHTHTVEETQERVKTWKQYVTSKERHVNWVNHDFKTFSVVTTTMTRLAANSSSSLIDKRHGVTEVYKKSSFICLLLCYILFFLFFSFIYSCLFYLFDCFEWVFICLFLFTLSSIFLFFIHFSFFLFIRSLIHPSIFFFFLSFFHCSLIMLSIHRQYAFHGINTLSMA